ncbi:hypothetical protein F5880DRAFT_1615883 [Lentinula raphanica]|nr:hypothetical protein F5880DRAFT_1615883 [Lentinula raphanica]
MLSLSPQLMFDTIEEWVKNPRDVHEIHASAQEVQEPTTEEITPLTLRPPEVILGGLWSEKVDIWTFGCLGFTLLTRLPLSTYTVKPRKAEYVPYQVAAFTNKRYPPAVLKLHPESTRYFEPDGKMKSFHTAFNIQ